MTCVRVERREGKVDMARASAWLAGIALILGAAPGAADVALEPHRAAYRLTLAGTQGGGPLTRVRGGLVIEWQRECEGWLSRQRIGFVAGTEGGETFSHDVRFSSWESLDGSRMRYSVRSFDGEAVDEEYRGVARVGDGAGGVARFNRPEEREVPLPPGTIFPTEHLSSVLAGAADGERLLTHEVFDGWGFDALTQITSVIGEPRPVDDPDAEPGRAWPISMAYYNVARGADVPEFEATFVLQDDGVMRELALDYGDFQLEGTLETLETLDWPDC